MAMMLFYGALSLSVFGLVALLLSPLFLKPSPEAQRVAALVATTRVDQRVLGLQERLQVSLTGFAKGLRRRLGMTVNVKSEARLRAAGLRDPAAPDLFLAAQCLMPLCGAFGGSFVPDDTMFWVCALCGAGYLAPGFWLTEKVRRRRERMRRSLPDAVDLLVICVDAGLGLDQAVLRVCDELQISHPDLQDELSRVYLEQRAGTARLDAWEHLSQRAKVPELTAFVSMLMQTDRFGTPIAKALGNFAAELRLKRRQIAEEAAAKTKIKIIFPLVFCIFPCLFIVLLAPAIIAISRGLGGVTK